MMSRLLPPLAMLAVWLGAQPAQAHIRLLQPTSWVQEDADGDPQKVGPCGTSSASPGTPTNMVTTYRAGETITVQWLETVYHPGHFRIALARERSELVDPDVTADGSGVSISAEVADPPSSPVLLDGLYPRTGNGKAGTTFTQQVTLPDMPCEKCTLQVIQFMAEHGKPYFYHHCADLKIVAGDVADGGQPAASPDAGTGADAGAGRTSDAGADAAAGRTSDAAADAGRPPGDGSVSADDSPVEDGCALGGESRRSGLPLIALALIWTMIRRKRAG